jgi:murein tripeptide amidase MpaA
VFKLKPPDSVVGNLNCYAYRTIVIADAGSAESLRKKRFFNRPQGSGKCRDTLATTVDTPDGPNMTSPRFDVYYRYPELSELLRNFAAEYPHLVRLHSIGHSHEGRDIWLATVTNFATGEDADKPALYVDGNLHATEVAGSMACLYLIYRLVHDYGTDAEVTRCLDTRVFYICPRLNPDGAEWALADIPRLIRSSTRPYPDALLPIGGLRREDVDGDGRVLTMRIPDPTGPWKICEQDPRLLVRREPAETGGEYFRLMPEGFIEDYDGFTLSYQPPREQLDMNRNYPANWRQEHEQPGAGPFPASEPEVRAAVRFVSEHRNITGAVTFHTWSGVLLRPYSHRADDTLLAEDLWTYRKIGDRGTELTGYPNISVFHDFRYHPKEVITGAFDDWVFDHLGCFAWTVELWSPQREAGITDARFIEWYREHPIEDDLKLLQWNDEVLGGRGFVDWYPFDHPQLGRVELGGWDSLYSWINPPHELLEREIAKFPPWLVWHLLISPKLELLDALAVPLSDDTWRITLVVQNTGWLPTYITKRALTNQLTQGVVCEIRLPEEARLVTGNAREFLGHLEGRAYTPVTPVGWGWGGDVTSHRGKVEWVLKAPAGITVQLFAHQERAGTLRHELVLGETTP